MSLFVTIDDSQELLYYYNKGFKYRELLQIYKFINEKDIVKEGNK